METLIELKRKLVEADKAYTEAYRECADLSGDDTERAIQADLKKQEKLTAWGQASIAYKEALEQHAQHLTGDDG